MKPRKKIRKNDFGGWLPGFVRMVQIWLLIGSFHVYAHQGERIYPIYERAS